MMDRNCAAELPKMQCGFIQFVCAFVYKVTAWLVEIQPSPILNSLGLIRTKLACDICLFIFGNGIILIKIDEISFSVNYQYQLL